MARSCERGCRRSRTGTRQVESGPTYRLLKRARPRQTHSDVLVETAIGTLTATLTQRRSTKAPLRLRLRPKSGRPQHSGQLQPRACGATSLAAQNCQRGAREIQGGGQGRASLLGTVAAGVPVLPTLERKAQGTSVSKARAERSRRANRATSTSSVKNLGRARSLCGLKRPYRNQRHRVVEGASDDGCRCGNRAPFCMVPFAKWEDGE